MNGSRRTFSTRRLLAWGVHAFTASGAVVGTLALWEIGRGGFERAALYMLVAFGIDALDGTLARRAGVTEQVPRIDGRRLDDIVDFLNFAIVPLVFLLAQGAFTHWSLVTLPVIASAYGFAQVDAKTDDDFFLGWPSYWNVLALYVWKLELTPGAATAWIALCSALVFVPLKYIYPSKLRRWLALTVAGGGVAWGLVLAVSVVYPEAARRLRLVELSLAFPIYYVALSAWLGDWLHWRNS